MAMDREEQEYGNSGDDINNDHSKNHYHHQVNGGLRNCIDNMAFHRIHYTDVGCPQYVDNDRHNQLHHQQYSRSIVRVCVFCGSQSGNKNVYGQVSIELGKLLVEHKMELVYGGGSCGLMGLIAKVVHHGGGHVIGVLPKAMTPFEISGESVGELLVVADMHERKTQMAQLADAFITLPGGYGTLEELLEIITCSQLGLNTKPVGLLNIDGYYDPLLELFDKFVKEGFIDQKARNVVISAATPNELICKMKQCISSGYIQSSNPTCNNHHLKEI